MSPDVVTTETWLASLVGSGWDVKVHGSARRWTVACERPGAIVTRAHATLRGALVAAVAGCVAAGLGVVATELAEVRP